MHERLTQSCNQISSRVTNLATTQGDTLLKIGHELTEIFTRGGQLVLAGDGPLQAVAQQTALAFSHRLAFERPPLPAIALGGNPIFTAALLADEKPREILAREYRCFRELEHMMLIFCGETPSQQIKQLISQCEDCRSLVLIGTEPKDAFPQDLQPKLNIKLQGDAPARLAETCLICGHLLCELVEGELFGL